MVLKKVTSFKRVTSLLPFALLKPRDAYICLYTHKYMYTYNIDLITFNDDNLYQ